HWPPGRASLLRRPPVPEPTRASAATARDHPSSDGTRRRGAETGRARQVRSGRTSQPTHRATHQVHTGPPSSATMTPMPSSLRTRLDAWGVTPRLISMAVSALVVFGLLLTMMVVRVPYGVQAPGPIVNTLGENNDVELITIDGTESY